MYYSLCSDGRYFMPLIAMEAPTVLEHVPMLRSVRLDDEESVVGNLASASGRVESAFWPPQQRLRRRSCAATPTGVLYVVNRLPNNFMYNELEQGRKIEENLSIDIKHSVSTCFEQGRLGQEKSILMTTSHNLDAKNIVTTQYVNNLNGGFEYTCNTTHAIFPTSNLFTSLYLASVGDPTLEVELEQVKETRKISKTIFANLKNGERLLKLQAKKNINDNIALSNTYTTNLRGKHSIKLEAALPLWGVANISKSFSTDFRESHEFCLKAQQRINEGNTLKTELIRSNKQVSMELKHIVQGTRDVAVKLISDMQGAMQVKVTNSHTKQPNCWGWTIRKVSGEGYSMGVEWKREMAPDKSILLRTSTQNQSYTLYGELRRPF